jgi:hypothetical protein
MELSLLSCRLIGILSDDGLVLVAISAAFVRELLIHIAGWVSLLPVWRIATLRDIQIQYLLVEPLQLSPVRIAVPLITKQL